MVHRDHINLSTTLFYIGLLAAGCSGVRLTYGNYAYLPFLFGSLLPDLDIAIYDKGHRFGSSAHNLGYALLSVAALSAAAAASSYFKVSFAWLRYAEIGLGISALAALGWTAHLVGDFFQGGIKFFGKKIGLRKLTWEIYYGQSTSLLNLSYLGAYIGWLLIISAPLSIYYCYRILDRAYVHPFPLIVFLACAIQGGVNKALKTFLTCSVLAGFAYLFIEAVPVFSWLRL